jgi:hypothetical protein
MPRPVNLTGYAIVVAPSVANRCSYTRGKDSGDLKKLAGLNCRKPDSFEGSKQHPRDRVPLSLHPGDISMKKRLLLGLLALALFALGVFVESHGLPNWLPR